MGTSFGNSQKKGQNAKMNFPETINYIWDEYISDSKNNTLLSFEMNQKSLSYNNKTLIFDSIIKGDKNKSKKLPLYLFLHNGGINQPSYNNGEFLKVRYRYQSCIQFGIVCSIKGVTDLSNMHYSNESLILLDRLIKSFIIFYNIDPNRVYLIGLGYGGDGVYKIINLLPCRFAAAVVISGHSYGKPLKNLLNLHLLIQVGENDSFSDKNKDAVRTYKEIREFYANMKNKYEQLNKKKKNLQNFAPLITKISRNSNINDSCVECYIHAEKEQDINDYDKKQNEVPIISDPIKWLSSENNNETIDINPNSINFVNKYTREPLPKFLYWDLTSTLEMPINYSNKQKEEVKDNTMVKDTRSGGEGFFSGSILASKDKDEKSSKNTVLVNKSYYWLEIGNVDVNSLGTLDIITRLDSKNNTVYIDSPIKYLRILLNENMIDFQKDVYVIYNEERQNIKLVRNYQTERRTLNERGDYTYIFSAALVFESKDFENFRIYQFEES